MPKKIPELQKNAYGVAIVINTTMDMTDTTSLNLYIRKPSGGLITRTLVSDDIITKNPGTIQYILQDGDINEVGIYYIQVAETDPGEFLPSEIAKFKVVANVF